MKLLLFGSLVDVIGKSEITMEHLTDVESLKSTLMAQYPKLSNQKFVIAINKQVVKDNVILKADDTIALLPPFSGG